MYGRRERCGNFGIHAGNDVVRHHNHGCTCGNACAEGCEVTRHKGFHVAVIARNGGVGIHVVAVAGEVL